MAMGLDLVKIQLLLAQGHPLSSLLSNLPEDPETPPSIQSLQLRVTAEDASNEWALSVGKVDAFRFPAGNGVRVDTHLLPSHPAVIGTYFDSLIAKIIITAPTWEDVVMKAKRALADTYIEGVKTNLNALRGIVASEDFVNQICDTQWLEKQLPSLLDSGKEVTAALASVEHFAPSSARSHNVAAASNVLFRKGDAWSISLTPEKESKSSPAKSAPSHLEVTRVLRNEFPASLTAQITYTTPTTSPTSYLMTIAATTTSFGSIASAATHRRGDPANPNHITIPFAGKLVELLVDEGDEIRKGDVVAVVQQMKMELEIRASRGGRVVWVYEGEEGDDVGEGVLVVELDDGGSKL
jgi:pyruvate carboxylase